MYRQIKGICTCIFLYVSITCTNGLMCYSCFVSRKNALNCKTITCEPFLSGDVRTACYYQMFPNSYERRGCGEMKSILPELIKGNVRTFYCHEDCCNGFYSVFLKDTRRHCNSTSDVDLSLDNVKDDWFYIEMIMFISIFCTMIAIICSCYFIIKSKCHETSDSFLNTNTARYRTTDFEYCGNNMNYYSDVSYNIDRSNYNNYRDDLYIYNDTNCDGANDVGNSGNDDGGGDRGAGDCCVGDNGGGDSGGGDCGGGDSGGGDCGGGDSGGGDCGGGDSGGGDCGGGDSGGGDCGGGDSGGGDCGGGDSGGGDCGGGDD